MKSFRFALVIALAIFCASPVAHAAENGTFSINCRGYQYTVKRVFDGYDIKVAKDGKTRTYFMTRIYESGSPYGASTITFISQCQGAKLPYFATSFGRYGSGQWLGLINPETTNITVEEALNGYTSWLTGPQSNSIRALYGNWQVAQVLSVAGGVAIPNNLPTQATVTYIQNGSKLTVNAPLLKPLTTDGLYIATTTAAGYQLSDLYAQAYYFDGNAVLVNEYKRLGTPGAHFCVQDNVNTCRDSLNKWYSYSNGAWHEIGEPNFDMHPTDELAWNRFEIVSKTRAMEGSNNLNDRSFYQYDAQNRVVRKTSASAWNTTIGTSKKTCGDTTYAIYEKQFADQYTYKRDKYTYPSGQFMLEIVRGTSIKAIPLPHDGTKSWENQSLDIIGCAGNSVIANTDYTYYETSDINSWKRFSATIIIKPTDTFIQTRNSARVNILESNYYWTSVSQSPTYAMQYGGTIYKLDGMIKGDATIRAITKAGEFVTIKPPYLKRLADYNNGSSMTFGLDKNGAIIASFYQSNFPELSSDTYYRYNGTSYQEITKEEYTRAFTSYDRGSERGSALSLQKDGSRIALKSFYLQEYRKIQPFLLHDFGTTNMQLNWYRVGPLESNGTRKIRYSVSVNGATQIWNAVVR